MTSQGVIVKRCGCMDPTSRRQLGKGCPRLAERGHGSWFFHCSVTNLLGRPERVRRGGYQSQAAAQRARDEFLAQSREERTADAWSMQRWLRYWLSTRTSIRPTTKLHYTRDVERFLIPYLGTQRLSELTSRQLNAIFAEIGKAPNRFGQPTSACTLQHIRTTLRAALNAAIREGLITDNPARRLELPTRKRAHALVWTEQRVTDWEQSGTRPAVAVWTPQQLADFLDQTAEERLFALWWLIALRGLRRGEAAGLRWSDIDLDQHQLEIIRQRTTAGHQVIECPPKSAASARIIALDKHTVRVLRAHATRQRQERGRRLAAGKDWADTGYVFTRADGTPIHPTYLTQRMRTLVKRAGLPPIRLRTYATARPPWRTPPAPT